MDERKAKELASGEYFRVQMQTTANYIAPIYLVQPETKKINNGTTFFLNCGEGVFGVTACHVVEEFIAIMETQTAALCQIGDNLKIDLADRLIDQDKDLDIATYRITEDEIKTINRTILTGCQKQWPPSPPEQDKGIFFAGYPGIERIVTKEQRETIIDFGIYFGTATASQITAKDIVCQFEREYWVDALGQGFPPEKYNMGGLSGAPLLTLTHPIKGNEDIVSWRLGGVIYQSASELFEGIYARRADFINVNGTINREYLNSDDTKLF